MSESKLFQLLQLGMLWIKEHWKKIQILIVTLFGMKGIKDIAGLDITGKLFPTTDENWNDGTLTDSFIVYSARDCSQLVPTVTEIFVVYIKKLRPNVFKSCGMR